MTVLRLALPSGVRREDWRVFKRLRLADCNFSAES